MLSSVLLTILLSAASLQAQLFGGMSHGGPTQSGVSIRSHPTRSGVFARHGERNLHISGFFPLWYGYGYEPFDYQPEPATNTAPQVVVLRPENQAPPPKESPPVRPLIINVPEPANAPASRPQSPAVFVLNNGQRLESSRYMITAQNLYVTISRKDLSIPLSMVDLDTTIATNRGRGIDLQIPDGPNRIVLGF
jgi:hypothetical protein